MARSLPCGAPARPPAPAAARRNACATHSTITGHEPSVPFSLYAIGPRSPTTAAWSSPNACGRPAAAPRQRLAAASVSSRFQFNLPFQLPGFPGGKDPKKQAAHEQLIAVCWAQVRKTPHMFHITAFLTQHSREGRFASGLLVPSRPCALSRWSGCLACCIDQHLCSRTLTAACLRALCKRRIGPAFRKRCS